MVFVRALDVMPIDDRILLAKKIAVQRDNLINADFNRSISQYAEIKPLTSLYKPILDSMTGVFQDNKNFELRADGSVRFTDNGVVAFVEDLTSKNIRSSYAIADALNEVSTNAPHVGQLKSNYARELVQRFLQVRNNEMTVQQITDVVRGMEDRADAEDVDDLDDIEERLDALRPAPKQKTKLEATESSSFKPFTVPAEFVALPEEVPALIATESSISSRKPALMTTESSISRSQRPPPATVRKDTLVFKTLENYRSITQAENRPVAKLRSILSKLDTPALKKRFSDRLTQEDLKTEWKKQVLEELGIITELRPKETLRLIKKPTIPLQTGESSSFKPFRIPAEFVALPEEVPVLVSTESSTSSRKPALIATETTTRRPRSMIVRKEAGGAEAIAPSKEIQREALSTIKDSVIKIIKDNKPTGMKTQDYEVNLKAQLQRKLDGTSKEFRAGIAKDLSSKDYKADYKERILRELGILPPLKGKGLKFMTGAGAKKQFQVLLGQLKAGNDSKILKKELKGLSDMLYKNNMLSKEANLKVQKI